MASHSYEFKQGRFLKMAMMLCMAALMVLVAACGGDTTQQNNGSHPTTLRMVPAPGKTNGDLFNPFFDNNHGADWGSQGLLYEPLYIVNLYDGTEIPWLAQSYENKGTQLTFHLRSGVKWNDGQDFTSADVVFTFQLLQKKENAALDTTGVLPFFTSVAAPDASTVVFTLPHPDSVALFHLGGGIYIVPQHVWGSQTGDLSKFANDTKPVGTGPYTLDSWNPNLITYKANPHYWGTKPQVPEIQVTTEKSNTTAIADMISGKLDWMGTGWSPDLDATYLQKSTNHDFFAPNNTVMLYLNLQKAPFNNLSFRKAVSAAIDRSKLPTGIAQYAKVADPTGVVTPNFKDWIGKSVSYDTADKVDGYMKQAGFTKASDGFYHDASGKVFTMTVNVPGPWSDWAQDVQNIVTSLNIAGIKTFANYQADYLPYFPDLQSGNYDAAISWTNSGPTPYYEFQALLASANSAAAGKLVSGTNFERWDSATSNGYSAQTDKLLADYEASSDVTAQKQAIQGLEDIMVSQVPVIPLTVNVNWAEYTTANWTGWPSAENPYDIGSPNNLPDAENVLLHLKPAH